MTPIKITVLLTTYKRPLYLQVAIESVLRQYFEEYELLIIDDASDKQTAKVVSRFQDTRIRYYANNKNLGFPGAFKRGLRLSRGKYIFLLSDDDFILKRTTLGNVFHKMEKFQTAFAETALIFYDESYKFPSSLAPPSSKKELFYKPSSDILLKILDWHIGFASGHVYKRDVINLNDIEDDVWFAHVKPVYRAVKNKGALYLANDYILGRISKTGNVAYLNISINKKFHMEKMFDMFSRFDNNKNHQKIFMKEHLEEGAINNFASIKYYTSNKNLLMIAKRILDIQPTYKWRPFFWINLITGFILPKSVLAIIRSMVHKNKQKVFQRELGKLHYQNLAKFIANQIP